MDPQSLNAPNPVKIDVHIHLAGSGCQHSGCWLSPSLRKRYTIQILKTLHRISDKIFDHNFDTLWPEKISHLVSDSPIDYGVILGFDGATNLDGEMDFKRSQMIIPASWVFKLCQQYPNLLPGPSINPHRKDALEQLAYCIEQKAVLIKWLPSAQLINPGHQSVLPFYRKLAEAGIPLLVHCGGERTFKSYDPSLNHLNLLRKALDEGVKVICAHSATKVLGSKQEEDQLPLLRKFLVTYPNLWVDNSGLCNPSRFAHLPRLAQDKLITARTLYGSDWPVPSNALYYLHQLGWKKTLALEKEKNWLNRDMLIKRTFGYPDKTLTQASKVLANLDYWCALNRHSLFT